MVDIASITAVLGSVKTATDIAKLIKDGASSIEEAELKLQIAELIGALADAKLEMASVRDQLAAKDEQIALLNERLNTKAKVEWEDPYYWAVNGDERDGPYCQRCYDDDSALIRLQKAGKGEWHCRVCSSRYRDSSYVRPKPITIRTI